MEFRDYLWHMDSALKLANRAYHQDEVPVGSLIVGEDGEILAETHNLKEVQNNPVAHAEVLALIEAGQRLSSWRLNGATLFVTLEPCPMCLSAMIQARVKRCVFGAYDPKGGALSLGYYLNFDNRLNHQFSVVGGIRHWECSQILSKYFREKREAYKKPRRSKDHES